MTNDDLHLIVMTGETSPVRRLRLTRSGLRRAAFSALAGGVIGVLALGLLLTDYVRLRREAIDVAQMRDETDRHRLQLDSLAGRVGALTSEFETLRALERRVRTIANLPERPVEATAPREGMGQGGTEEPASDGPVDPAPPPQRTKPPAEEPVAATTGFDAAALARVQAKAEHLAAGMPERQERFEDLVLRLEGLARRMAATPAIWPTDGWVTSGFGYRRSPFTGRRQFHTGLDIAADYGTAIVAPAEGRVVFVGVKGALGRTVVIDHGYGLRTSFGHTAEALVRPGQHVTRGQAIARVGSTGRSTGPHLHYTIEQNGRPVDPSPYIFE